MVKGMCVFVGLLVKHLIIGLYELSWVLQILISLFFKQFSRNLVGRYALDKINILPSIFFTGAILKTLNM